MIQYDDDDAFENGVLRDGARYRVPMHMRDSRPPMVTDGTGDAFGLQRPDWRIRAAANAKPCCTTVSAS